MKKIPLFLTLLSFLFFINVKGQSIIYVKSSAMSLGNGTSWSSPYHNLQIAIDNATSGDTIWVAKGTYKPTKSYNSSTVAKTKSFILKDSIKIFGGFQGTESSLSQRVLSNSSQTILSGDIGVANDSSDNVYHVVTAINVKNVLLNGLSIRYGNADTTYLHYIGNDTIAASFGGGLYIDSSSIDLDQLRIEMNYAKIGGAGMNLKNSNATIQNTIYSGNIVNGNGFNPSNGGGGAGIRNENSNPSIRKSLFFGNLTKNVQGGGAMRNVNSNPIIDSSTFSNNYVEGGDGGGAVYNLYSNPTFTEVRIDSNSTNEEGEGVYSDSSDPTFIGVVFESNSSGSDGGAMENDAGTATLNNVIFRTNSTVGDGGAINNWKSNLDLTNVTFNTNQAGGDGGAIASYTNCFHTMNKVTFNDNYSSKNGGAIYNNRNSHTSITNGLLYNNHADLRGGGIYTKAHYPSGQDSSSVILTNVTITKNTADTSGVGGYDDGFGNSKLRNSIIYGNMAANLPDVDAPQNMVAVAVSHSIIGNDRYTTGIVAPTSFSTILFKDSVNNDFRLDTLSPGIDNGDSSVYNASATPNLSAITTDIRGADRMAGNNVDIGAYEGAQDTIFASVSLSYTQSGNTLTFTAVPTNGGQSPSYKWYVNNVLVIGISSNQYVASANVDIFNNDWVKVGIYPTETTLASGNQDSVQVVITGLDKNTETDNQFRIYPNPNNGSFTIANNSEKTEVLSYTITDLTGRELYREENKSNTQAQQIFQLDLSNGLYFLTITNQKGERKSLKFMVGR